MASIFSAIDNERTETLEQPSAAPEGYNTVSPWVVTENTGAFLIKRCLGAPRGLCTRRPSNRVSALRKYGHRQIARPDPTGTANPGVRAPPYGVSGSTNNAPQTATRSTTHGINILTSQFLPEGRRKTSLPDRRHQLVCAGDRMRVRLLPHDLARSQASVAAPTRRLCPRTYPTSSMRERVR